MWQDQKIGLLSGRKPINQDPDSEQPKKRRSVRSYAMYIIWLCTGTDDLLPPSSSFFVASSFFDRRYCSLLWVNVVRHQAV
jgi:hypothetical protein